MDHAAAKQFNPTCIAAYLAAFFVAKRAAQCEFEARLGEREVERLRPNVELLAVIFLQKGLKRGDKHAGMYALAHVHALELIERMLMPRIEVFVPENPARDQAGYRITL